jgi:hypothetical protein
LVSDFDFEDLMDFSLAINELSDAYANGAEVLAVHYACENFYEVVDRPVAVSCVAIGNLRDQSTDAYALSDVPPGVAPDQREIDVLDYLYRRLKRSPDAYILHWNMNSSVYGFTALGLRYRYLTRKQPPFIPNSANVYDLDALLTGRFGEGYVNHPKLPNLAALNKLNKRSLLHGAEEADRFTTGDFGIIKLSTSAKVRVICGLFERLIDRTLQTQESVGSVEFAGTQLDAVATVLQLGQRMRLVERSLSRRYGSRATLIIEDEYDAQDLLRALLSVFFDDVRPETWTPNHAGGSARIDFLLPAFGLAIELKMIRPTLQDRKLADELTIDAARYKVEPSTTHLICLVFDHEGRLDNPRGLEKDLGQKVSEEGIAVTVRIYDR